MKTAINPGEERRREASEWIGRRIVRDFPVGALATGGIMRTRRGIEARFSILRPLAFN